MGVFLCIKASGVILWEIYWAKIEKNESVLLFFLSGKHLQKMLDFWEFSVCDRQPDGVAKMCGAPRKNTRDVWSTALENADPKLEDEDPKPAGQIRMEEGWLPSDTAALTLPHLSNLQ